MKPRLGVNIDHIATLREARKCGIPDPVASLPILEECGVDQVTLHLREDRRHIQDRDLEAVIQKATIPVNLEMALTDEMVGIALRLKPATATIVPEKRQEITTEGGLDCERNVHLLEKEIPRLKDKGIRVSLFIDPDRTQIDLAAKLRADAVELHTGTYCEAFGRVTPPPVPLPQGEGGITPSPLRGEGRGEGDVAKEFQRLRDSARYAAQKGLKVFAGHGLNTQNLLPVVSIREIEEYNIGHSIIARAVFVGLEAAIREIQEILK
ncbi:MAG: pyridoxine 5'-phosphate synthase [Deltaproteobacteria bacterium]|nr:pyridoxine 5'-phosphate synthase [Deltaproteobacteria bacterium]